MSVRPTLKVKGRFTLSVAATFKVNYERQAHAQSERYLHFERGLANTV